MRIVPMDFYSIHGYLRSTGAMQYLLLIGPITAETPLLSEICCGSAFKGSGKMLM